MLAFIEAIVWIAQQGSYGIFLGDLNASLTIPPFQAVNASVAQQTYLLKVAGNFASPPTIPSLVEVGLFTVLSAIIGIGFSFEKDQIVDSPHIAGGLTFLGKQLRPLFISLATATFAASLFFATSVARDRQAIFSGIPLLPASVPTGQSLAESAVINAMLQYRDDKFYQLVLLLAFGLMVLFLFCSLAADRQSGTAHPKAPYFTATLFLLSMAVLGLILVVVLILALFPFTG